MRVGAGNLRQRAKAGAACVVGSQQWHFGKGLAEVFDDGHPGGSHAVRVVACHAGLERPALDRDRPHAAIAAWSAPMSASITELLNVCSGTHSKRAGTEASCPALTSLTASSLNSTVRCAQQFNPSFLLKLRPPRMHLRRQPWKAVFRQQGHSEREVPRKRPQAFDSPLSKKSPGRRRLTATLADH